MSHSEAGRKLIRDRKLVDHWTFVRLCGVRDWIAQHYDQRLSLAQVADFAGYSPFHLQRLFTRAFGETPHEFQTRLRLEKAQQALRTGASQVTEVCFDLGYESLGSFSTLFRSRIGVSPAEYRRVFALPGELWALKATPACFRRFR